MRSRPWAPMILVALLASVIVAGCGGSGRAPTATLVPTKTPRPTFTRTPAQPTAVPATRTPAQPPTATRAPATPTPAPTPRPPSPTPEKAAFVVSDPTINVRSGPGTNYAKLGELAQGQSFDITGKNAAGSWWQFTYNGQPAWVSNDFVTVKAAGGVQVAGNIPAAPPTSPPLPTSPPRPTNTPAPVFRYAMTGKFQLRVNSNPWVTVWCFVMTRDGNGLIAGTLRVTKDGVTLKDQAFQGGTTPAFGDPGIERSEYLYNPGCKVELPAANGNYTAYIVEGDKAVSDAFSFAVSGETNRTAIIEWREK